MVFLKVQATPIRSVIQARAMPDKIKHSIEATVKTTGEVIEYIYSSSKELSKAYKDVEAKLEAYGQIKRVMLSTAMNIMIKEENRKDKEDADTN